MPHEAGFLLQTLNDRLLVFREKNGDGTKIHKMEARHIKAGVNAEKSTNLLSSVSRACATSACGER
ncbi:hypothetical protein ACLK19_06475 [Escherichia coli]